MPAAGVGMRERRMGKQQKRAEAWPRDCRVSDDRHDSLTARKRRGLDTVNARAMMHVVTIGFMPSQLDFFEKLLQLDTQKQIVNVFTQQAAQLGFSSFLYSPLRTPDEPAGFFKDERLVVPVDELRSKGILTTYPVDWFLHYQQAGHISQDPVLARAVSSPLPVLWNRVAPPQHPVMDEARQHGLASGITVTVGGGAGSGGTLLSLASDRKPECALEMAPRHEVHVAGQAMLLALHLHEAVLRLPSSMALQAPVPTLTKREKECLQWAAIGKTSWEIGQILAISERTAIFHIANATRKLGATNRRQAVVRALGLRLITL